MLHTMHFIGLGRSHDEALHMAGTIANRTFSAIMLLNGQRISQLSTILLPDPAPSIKQIALVYVLDVPPGADEILDARRAEVEQEVRAAFPAPVFDQVFFPFRAAIGLSPNHRATRQIGPYTIIVQPDTAAMYLVLVQLRNEEPHLSELCGNLNKCEEFLQDNGLPLDGWCAVDATERKHEVGT